MANETRSESAQQSGNEPLWPQYNTRPGQELAHVANRSNGASEMAETDKKKPRFSLKQKLGAGAAVLAVGIPAFIGIVNAVGKQPGVDQAPKEQDVPAAVEAQEPANTLELTPGQRDKVDHAAIQAALLNIDAVRDRQKLEDYPRKPYMSDGALNYSSARIVSVKGKTYDEEFYTTDVIAKPLSTANGLEITLKYLDGKAYYKSNAGESDIVLADSQEHELVFNNRGSEVFSDGEVTVGELKTFLEDPDTTLVSAKKFEKREEKGELTFASSISAEIDPDGVVTTSGGEEPSEVLAEVTNAG